jgi:hypothetical protein
MKKAVCIVGVLLRTCKRLQIWALCAGFLEQSNRVGVGLSWPARLYRLTESIPRLLTSLKIPSLKFSGRGRQSRVRLSSFLFRRLKNMELVTGHFEKHT